MEIRLKELRKAKGLTQKELAEKIGVKLPTYRTWERGLVVPNLEQAYNCAVALDCTLTELAGTPSIKEYELDKNEQFLIDTYRSVTIHGKKAMLSNTKAVRADYMPKSDEAGVSEARSA